LVLKLVWWYSYQSYAASLIQAGLHGEVEGYQSSLWLLGGNGLYQKIRLVVREDFP